MTICAAIIKIQKQKRQTGKNSFAIVMVLETKTLADVAIKLDETRQRAEDAGDEATYEAFIQIT